MSSTRRLLYQGIIYRFKFLLWATLICAAATLFAYIMGQVCRLTSIALLLPSHCFSSDLKVSEDQWYWEDEAALTPLQWKSAMFTTVYALWNCYVITLLILYAPSHKEVRVSIGIAIWTQLMTIMTITLKLIPNVV